MPAPYSGHADTDDVHCLFRLDETSGGAVDEAGGTALATTGTVGTEAGLVTSPAPTTRGARSFSSSLVSRTAVGADIAAFGAQELTVMAWIRQAATKATATIVCCGNSGATEATNIQLLLRCAGSELQWVSERDASVVSTALTSGASLSAGEKHHVAFVRARPASGTAGRCDVRLYVDGVLVRETLDTYVPTGGTSNVLSIGGRPGLGSEGFDGEIDDVVAYEFAATEGAVRAAYARGIRDFDLDRVRKSSPALYHRALIEVDGTWVDTSTLVGYDYGEALEWQFNVEDQVKTARATLLREHNGISLAPFVESAASAKTEPVVKLQRRIILEECLLPAGSPFDNASPFWEPFFEGFITAHNVAGRKIELELADNGAELQDTWFEPDRTLTPPAEFQYGSKSVSKPLEGELQQIVDDQEPAGGWRQGPIALRTPTSPGWNTLPWYTPSDKHVMAELEQDADQIGWRCRYLWDDARKRDRLTLYEPDRTKTWQSGDADFQTNEVRTWRMFKRDSTPIRNAVEVAAGDSSDPDALGEFARTLTLVTDASSIAEYGRRYCRIGLATVTELDDATQQARLANNMLSDLAQPASDIEIEVPFHPFLEVEDMVRLQPDDQRIDVATDFAVVGIRHKVSGESRSTTVTLRRKVTGRRLGWFKLIQAQGFSEPDGDRPPQVPSNASIEAAAHGIIAKWDWLGGRLNGRFDGVEVHVGDSDDFAIDDSPGSTTLQEFVRGIGAVTLNVAPGEEKWVRLRSRDDRRNKSEPTAAIAVTPRYLWAIPVVTAHRGATAQSVAKETATEVDFDVEDLDPASVFAASRFTMPTSGQAHVSCIANIDFLGKTGQEARLLIYNVTTASYIRRGPKDNSGGTDIANVHISADVPALKGQVLAVHLYASEVCDVVGAAALTDSETWVNWRLVNET